jgi:hypothetical protein
MLRDEDKKAVADPLGLKIYLALHQTLTTYLHSSRLLQHQTPRLLQNNQRSGNDALLRRRIPPIRNSNDDNTRFGIKPRQDRLAVRLPIKRYADSIQPMIKHSIVLCFVLEARLVIRVREHKWIFDPGRAVVPFLLTASRGRPWRGLIETGFTLGQPPGTMKVFVVSRIYHLVRVGVAGRRTTR